MSTVIYLSGTSMGDALGATGRSLQSDFETQGHDFLVLNFADPTSGDLLNQQIVKGNIEFVFSHMGMCNDLVGTTPDGRNVNFWAEMRIPFLSLYGDSPAYFFDRHIVPGNSFACMYGFPEHVLLRKSLPKINGLVGLAPPHVLDATPKREINFSLKEKGRLLFLKNGNDPNQLLSAWRDGLSHDIFQMIAELASELASKMDTDYGCNIDNIVRDYFNHKGLDIEHSPTLRLFFIAQLDDYLRRLKSTFIAETLLDFPIEIHGYNWEHVDFSGRRATHVQGGDYARSKYLIKDSLGTIDMSPNTTLAPHERPLRAFGMYTLCLTNEQFYFKNNFPQHDTFSFRFDKDNLQSKVASVLASPRRFVEFGIEVAETFEEICDSTQFARTMLETASCLRLVSGPRPQNLQQFFVWPPTKL